MIGEVAAAAGECECDKRRAKGAAHRFPLQFVSQQLLCFHALSLAHLLRVDYPMRG